MAGLLNQTADAWRRPVRWLMLTGIVIASLNAALVLALILHGDRPIDAAKSTAPVHSRALLDNISNDSWYAMAKAQEHFDADPKRDLYGVFFDQGVKFQYPPSALLVLDLFPESLYSGYDSLHRGSPLNAMLSMLTRIALLLTVLFSAAILYRAIQADARERGEATSQRPLLGTALFWALCLALGLTFYPLVRGYSLGQIQVFLGCLAAGAILAFQSGRRGLAGACLGLCCLIKPQFAVVLLWGLLRREWRFAGWFVAVGLAGAVFSLLEFGWYNHLRYLDVLRLISKHGEAFGANQSINGLLNRLLGNGEAVIWSESSFAPFHPVVYYTTLITSVIILVFALKPPRDRSTKASALDMSIAILGATMASPVAWEHHYGVLLPIFAVAVPPVLRALPGRAGPVLLISAYVLSASVLLRPEYVFATRWSSFLGAHLFFGAATLFVLLLMTRARLPAASAVYR